MVRGQVVPEEQVERAKKTVSQLESERSVDVASQSHKSTRDSDAATKLKQLTLDHDRDRPLPGTGTGTQAPGSQAGLSTARTANLNVRS